MRLVLVALLAGMLATGGFLALNPGEVTTPAPAGDHIVEIGGGAVTYSSALKAGERFLKQVPLPDHLENRYQADPEDEEPGDGHDDDLLITQRRNTDHSWWTRPTTGYIQFKDYHGTQGNPICICDMEFVLSNETEDVDGVHIDIETSSHVLIDNITVYGGALFLDRSNHITVSRSQFISSYVTGQAAEDVLIWDNDFFTDEGPLMAFESDPIIEDPTGIHNCWPNPACLRSGLNPIQASRWTVMWNYFDSGGPGGIGFAFSDFHLEHNTILNPVTMRAGFNGDNVVKWNLIRGFGVSGIKIGGDTCLVENNSIVLTFSVYPLSEIILQQPGVHVGDACEVTMRHNDLVGYGTQISEVHRGGAPALWNSFGTVVANDNYWGTMHDPKLPPKRWISTSDLAETVVDRWFIEPIHEVTPIVYGLNAQDLNRWLDEAPKRVNEMPDHAVAWAEDQLPVP